MGIVANSIKKNLHNSTCQLDSLEKVLGVSFDDRNLLRLAFVHKSYLNENLDGLIESNERLEFLGDALIGWVIAAHLYQLYPSYAEGELTLMRIALVRGETLAKVATSLCLGEYLLMGKGEETSGGRERTSNLEAVFEALIGAMYLDQGYENVRMFLIQVMSKELSNLDKRKSQKDSKSILAEFVQSKGCKLPDYRVVKVTGKSHRPQFTVDVLIEDKIVGTGIGNNKSQAEESAAIKALETLF